MLCNLLINDIFGKSVSIFPKFYTYDKSQKEFHGEDTKKNARNAVTEEVELVLSRRNEYFTKRRKRLPWS